MDSGELEQHNQRNVERLLRRIAELVAERQGLRARDPREHDLEENRLEIVRCQSELNRALIDVYGRRAA